MVDQWLLVPVALEMRSAQPQCPTLLVYAQLGSCRVLVHLRFVYIPTYSAAVHSPHIVLMCVSRHRLHARTWSLTRPIVHAQTRLLAVELADELFARSKAFRGLLAPRFSPFLDRTLGKSHLQISPLMAKHMISRLRSVLSGSMPQENIIMSTV